MDLLFFFLGHLVQFKKQKKKVFNIKGEGENFSLSSLPQLFFVNAHFTPIHTLT